MRPFDGSRQWWRDELAQLAQVVHQGHTHEDGTWRICPMASCERARSILADSETEPPAPDAAARLREIADELVADVRPCSGACRTLDRLVEGIREVAASLAGDAQPQSQPTTRRTR